MVRIIADTTSSIPTEMAYQLGIEFLPQIIVFGDESYRDDTEIDTATFLAKLKASPTLPKTAAPPPALYTPIYQKITDAGDSAIVICPSADVSGTVRSATVAAQDFPNSDIRVIDTRTIATGLGSIVMQAVKWAAVGLSTDEIVAKIQNMCAHQHTYFMVDTLDYLYKGGRIGGAAMLFGSVLQVKPILTLSDGHIEPQEKQRTKQRAMARLKEIIRTECPTTSESYITVMYGDNKDEAETFANDLKQGLGFRDIPLYLLPSAILVHAGPNVFGISFFSEN
ncbi:EDD domain protein, DegV family [Longilinea arvoryzae]|uniref:EDD domain protein, DegV family n=1 Tax=Longilinea arvoryzae TaxID=360412 RepID=A0A0S7BAY2_9CHLR|nr:DegV family protein [Longilinea arvoryzae]GAP14759.1 EDD domain protein, DegV family [Longilinea arvoryzae]